MTSTLSTEAQQLIASYVDRGWIDATGNSACTDVSRDPVPRPAYLVIASGIRVLPGSEVQVTTRLYRWFRGRKLAVVSRAARRFDLIDLKISNLSQFCRGEALPLGDFADEAAPELIQWPLKTCGPGDEVSVRTIIPTPESGEDRLGAEFEMILIGEGL